MNRMVAICGLICTECPAYIATQADDLAAKERVAAEWREAFGLPEIDIGFVTCDGCLSVDGRLGGYTGQCPVRACGLERRVVNCAHCPDYACQKLEAFFADVPSARTALEEIRSSL